MLVVLAGALLAVVWAGTAQGAPTEVVIQSVTVDTNWTPTLTINVTGFDTKQDTEVLLGGDQLSILTETPTEIVAELSPVVYGSYLLEVIVSGREDEFDLTITGDQSFEAEIAALQATVTDLSDTVASLETQLADQQDDITTLETLLAGVSRGVDAVTDVDTLVFSGINLQVVNGTGDTGTINGAGNIIIGYSAPKPDDTDPDTPPFDQHREGSHNLVMVTRTPTRTHLGWSPGSTTTSTKNSPPSSEAAGMLLPATHR